MAHGRPSFKIFITFYVSMCYKAFFTVKKCVFKLYTKKCPIFTFSLFYFFTIGHFLNKSLKSKVLKKNHATDMIIVIA